MIGKFPGQLKLVALQFEHSLDHLQASQAQSKTIGVSGIFPPTSLHVSGMADGNVSLHYKNFSKLKLSVPLILGRFAHRHEARPH